MKQQFRAPSRQAESGRLADAIGPWLEDFGGVDATRGFGRGEDQINGIGAGEPRANVSSFAVPAMNASYAASYLHIRVIQVYRYTGIVADILRGLCVEQNAPRFSGATRLMTAPISSRVDRLQIVAALAVADQRAEP